MRVICLASSKGGSQKSATSVELAVAAERAGAGPVALVDLDEQGTTAAWCQAREAETPALAEIEIAKLQAGLDGLAARGFQTAILDTPGYVARDTNLALAVSDLIIVPVRPTPHDLRTVPATLRPVEASGKPFVFVLVGATPRARLTESAIRELAKNGLVAPTTIHNRQGVPQAHISGLSVSEIDADGPAAREYAELWTYVVERLARTKRGKVRAVA